MSARILPFPSTPWRSLRLWTCINAQLAELEEDLSNARQWGAWDFVRRLEEQRDALLSERGGLADG